MQKRLKLKRANNSALQLHMRVTFRLSACNTRMAPLKRLISYLVIGEGNFTYLLDQKFMTLYQTS